MKAIPAEATCLFMVLACAVCAQEKSIGPPTGYPGIWYKALAQDEEAGRSVSYDPERLRSYEKELRARLTGTDGAVVAVDPDLFASLSVVGSALSDRGFVEVLMRMLRDTDDVCRATGLHALMASTGIPAGRATPARRTERVEALKAAAGLKKDPFLIISFEADQAEKELKEFIREQPQGKQPKEQNNPETLPAEAKK